MRGRPRQYHADGVLKTCEQCGESFGIRPHQARSWWLKRARFCSKSCASTFNNLKRGVDPVVSRYRRKVVDGRNRPEHRAIMERYLGKTLPRNEVVHHKNEDKLDNRIENLEVLIVREHERLHNPPKYSNTRCCIICGVTFESHGPGKHKRKTCSDECYHRERRLPKRRQV